MCKNGHLGLHIILIKCIFYTNMIFFTIVFNYNLYKTGSLAQNFTKYKIRQLGHFFDSKVPVASHPQVRLLYLFRSLLKLPETGTHV